MLFMHARTYVCMYAHTYTHTHTHKHTHKHTNRRNPRSCAHTRIRAHIIKKGGKFKEQKQEWRRIFFSPWCQRQSAWFASAASLCAALQGCETELLRLWILYSWHVLGHLRSWPISDVRLKQRGLIYSVEWRGHRYPGRRVLRSSCRAMHCCLLQAFRTSCCSCWKPIDSCSTCAFTRLEFVLLQGCRHRRQANHIHSKKRTTINNLKFPTRYHEKTMVITDWSMSLGCGSFAGIAVLNFPRTSLTARFDQGGQTLKIDH